MNDTQIEAVLNELNNIQTGKDILELRERALKLDLEKLKAETIQNPDILLEIQKEDINDLDNRIELRGNIEGGK